VFVTEISCNQPAGIKKSFGRSDTGTSLNGILGLGRGSSKLFKLTMAKPSSSPGQLKGRPAYLVLGMHRSGTSALTQLLALAGAKLPNNLMPGDAHNAKGYFEPWRIAVFNNERLWAAGSAWDDPLTDPDAELPDADEWSARATKLFRSEYRRAGIPLLKDPRVSVLLPLWRQVLESENLEARCVIPVRHPLAVAGSLRRRDSFPELKSVLLWMNYMVATERRTRDLARAFVEYDALLTDWHPVVSNMEKTLGTRLPRLDARAQAAIDDFLTSDLRHNNMGGSMEAFGEIGHVAQGVHEWLLATARGERADIRLMNAGHDLIRRLRQEIGPLVSPVTLAKDQALSHLFETQSKLKFTESQVVELRARAEQYALMNDSLGTHIGSLTVQVKDLETIATREVERSSEIVQAATNERLQTSANKKLLIEQNSILINQLSIVSEERRNLDDKVRVLIEDKSDISNHLSKIIEENSILINQLSIVSEERQNLDDKVRVLIDENSNLNTHLHIIIDDQKKLEIELDNIIKIN